MAGLGLAGFRKQKFSCIVEVFVEKHFPQQFPSWPLHWFAMPAGNPQAQQGGNSQLPSEASTVLGKDSAGITWIQVSVCAMGELFGDQVSKAANILFSPGFTSSHLFHKILVTKITELQYLHLKLLLVQKTIREALKAAPEGAKISG